MLRPLPTAAQLRWQRSGFGVFYHFGINTFTGREWGTGAEDPALFDPAELDTDQWLAVAAAAGARYAVLTAKHHDGFCLWPTATTGHSVAASPWRGGGGDLVAEFVDSCRRHGIGPGLYLSPWDRNAACYPDVAAYDKFYLAQLTELCTGYGPLDELWFDGAGSAGRSYDWNAIMDLVGARQPEAMVFNMGRPTIRWIGNEDGLAQDPVRYAVDRIRNDNYTDAQLTVAGSYLPPECDVSIRRGWFHHAAEGPKSLDHLLAIHYRSIGLGANLLLNLPPDTRGLIPDEDAARMAEWRAELDARFGRPAPTTVRDEPDGTVTADFGAEITLDHLDLVEELEAGQRITGHEIRTEDGGLLASGQTVGVLRRHVFGARTVRRLLLTGTTDEGLLAAAHLDRILAHHTGHVRPPQLPPDYAASTEPPG